MSTVIPFEYHEDMPVRVVMVEGEPWFPLADLCTALDISHVGTVAARLDEADVGQTNIRSGGQTRALTIVNESGMYEVIFRSDKPEAVAFRRWLTTVVLPSIRKTGQFVARPTTLDGIRAMIDQIEAAQNAADLANARLDGIEGRHGWFSALGYAKRNGLPTGEKFLARVGKQAAVLARSHSVTPEPVEHKHFGTVNSFPQWIWDLATEGFEA